MESGSGERAIFEAARETALHELGEERPTGLEIHILMTGRGGEVHARRVGPGAHREDLARIATPMTRGARWTAAALFFALLVEIPFGIVPWIAASLLLLAAVAHRRTAPFYLGALTLTPLVWVEADVDVNALVAWAPYDWTTTFYAWCLVGLVVLLATPFMRLGSVIVKALERHTQTLWMGSALCSVALALIGSVVALASDHAAGHGEWSTFVSRVSGPGALASERARVVASADTRIEIPAPSLVERAWVVHVAPADVQELVADGRTRPSESLPPFLRRCLVPRDGAAVLVEMRTGSGLIPLHDSEHPRGCALVGGEPLRMATAGLDGPIGAPRRAGWSMLLALLVGAALLALAETRRRRARWIARLLEATPIRDLEGGASTARLASGKVVRLGRKEVVSAIRILVDPEGAHVPSDTYRADPRTRAATWLAIEQPQETLVNAMLVRAEAVHALAVLCTVWLATPALTAWSRGFVVSVW
ncbi:MAG: hypothetical protein U0353_16970 [Sandaracinus sp.]